MNNSDILQILIQAEFGQKIRGYDPLEVDEVLDQAVVEIQRLTQACTQATERAEAAERQLEEEIGPARRSRQESEEVLLEAKEEALRLKSEVEEEVNSLRIAAEKKFVTLLKRVASR